MYSPLHLRFIALYGLLLTALGFGCNAVPEPRSVHVADYAPPIDTAIQAYLTPFSDATLWKITSWEQTGSPKLPVWSTENGTATSIRAQGSASIHLEMKLEKGSTLTLLLQNQYPLVFKGDPEAEGQGAVSGIAASANASRSSGLWQTLDLVFYEPVEEGNTSVPARLFRATLNGIAIHEQVLLPKNNTASESPLVVKAEGKVAVRKLAIHDLTLNAGKGNVPVPALMPGKSLRYEYYEKESFQLLAHFAGSKKVGEGESTGFDIGGNSKRESHYGLKYFGNFGVAQKGQYQFLLTSDDGSRMYLDGKEIITNDGTHGDETRESTLTLEAGDHAFEVDYFQGEGGASLRMDYTGNGLPILPFFSPEKGAVDQNMAAYDLKPEKEPVIQRSFLIFPPIQTLAMGEDPQRRTHGISVGDPAGNHLAVDAGQGSLLMLWHGNFANAFNMWDGRGNWQNLAPLGQVISLNGRPNFTKLEKEEAGWPDSVAFQTSWVPKGYVLDDQGWPTFEYSLEGAAIADKFVSAEKSLVRTTHVEAKDQPVYFLLAAGESVEPIGKGQYAVQGPGYFVKITSCKGAELLLRQTADGQELVAKIKPGTGDISTSLTW